MFKKRLMGIATAFALGCAVLLAGCGGPSAEELIREDVVSFFDTFVHQEGESYDEFVESFRASAGLDEIGVDDDEFLDSYLDGFAYNIDDLTVDGDTATVTITLNCKKMEDTLVLIEEKTAALYEDPEQLQDMTDDEINAMIGEMILTSLDETELSETTFSVTYTKLEEGWSIDQDEAIQGIQTAMLGNM